MNLGSAFKILLSIIIIISGLLVVSCGTEEPEPEPYLAPAAIHDPAQAPPEGPDDKGPDETTQRKASEVKIMQWDKPPAMTIDTNKKYTAVMETEKGTMVIELFAKDVPVTVNNFVFLAREGYYDGTTFHRVLANFMVQGGDPTGKGTGGPGYRFEDEFTEHGHDAGALSMANAGPNTNGSQFFICLTAQHGLDGRHAVFGQLVEGMDVLKSITLRDPNQNPQFEGDKIIKLTIKEE
jgi:cyclophilin family peptidyl-prolyl cis-trans isomerase